MGRAQTLHLTIQFQIPQNLLELNTSSELKTINHLRVLYAHPTQDLPTLASLLPPTISSAEVVVVIPFHPSYSNPTPIDILLRQPRPKLFFPPLAVDKPLEAAFKGMSWVEFPVLKIMSRIDWEKELGEGRVAIVPPAEGIGRVEKRQIDDGWGGRKRMRHDEGTVTVGVVESVPAEGAVNVAVPAGLAGLGEYESDEEVDEVVGEEVTEEDIKIMRTLGAAAAADMA
jgi:hypothetical protein